MEIWKEIPGISGYKVSNKGRVKSFRKHKGGIIINCSTDSKGYLYLDLRRDKPRKTYKVHRLIAIAFIPNPNNYEQINHRDFDKKNNDVKNLEWVTNSYNTTHAMVHGRKRKKLSYDEVQKIKIDNRTHKDISIDYGVSITTISDIKNKKTWNYERQNKTTD